MGLSVLFYATLLLAHGVQSCTIVELDSSGFAENAYSLLHALPMFFQRNGTFFLDNSKFTFKCSNHGGWHDFFSGEENIVPWSRQKETMHGEKCARYTRHEVDQLLHTVVQTKPDLLDFIGIKKVSLTGYLDERDTCFLPSSTMSLQISARCHSAQHMPLQVLRVH